METKIKEKNTTLENFDRINYKEEELDFISYQIFNPGFCNFLVSQFIIFLVLRSSYCIYKYSTV